MTKVTVEKKVTVSKTVRVEIPMSAVVDALREKYPIIPTDVPAESLVIVVKDRGASDVLCIGWTEVE